MAFSLPADVSCIACFSGAFRCVKTCRFVLSAFGDSLQPAVSSGKQYQIIVVHASTHIGVYDGPSQTLWSMHVYRGAATSPGMYWVAEAFAVVDNAALDVLSLAEPIKQ